MNAIYGASSAWLEYVPREALSAVMPHQTVARMIKHADARKDHP